MRLFGALFNFDREGKGVSKYEPKKPEFIRFWNVLFRHFFDICKVSILYVLFCIPIITIGPATAAATYVLRNIAREEHAFIWMDFYDNFKKNFKQSFVTGIIDLAVTALFGVNLWVYINAIAQEASPKYLYFMLGVAVVIFLCYFIAKMYLYPILVTFDISIKNAYKNSFIFTLIKFPGNILQQFASFIKQTYGAFIISCNDYPTLLEYMHHDKKNNNANCINFTLLRTPGVVEINNYINDEEVKQALDLYRDLLGV